MNIRFFRNCFDFICVNLRASAAIIGLIRL